MESLLLPIINNNKQLADHQHVFHKSRSTENAHQISVGLNKNMMLTKQYLLTCHKNYHPCQNIINEKPSLRYFRKFPAQLTPSITQYMTITGMITQQQYQDGIKFIRIKCVTGITTTESQLRRKRFDKISPLNTSTTQIRLVQDVNALHSLGTNGSQIYAPTLQRETSRCIPHF